MPRQFIARFLLTLMPLWLAHGSFAATDTQYARTCDAAANRAARAEGVPVDVLRAITRVETGRTRNGRRTPWPWTVNMEGKGFWFDTEAEAKSYVFRMLKTGARSFDVGCFQINYRWHGHAFHSIDAMFDPDENAIYAARFLRDLYAEFGSWPAAAGAYHSRTDALANAYSRRFAATLAGLGNPPGIQVAGSQTEGAGSDPFTTAAQPLAPMVNASPLGSGTMGSLVPVSGTRAAFIVFN